MFSTLIIGALALSFLDPTHAFYLPGAAPRSYKLGEDVKLFVNALTPMLLGTDNAKLVRLPRVRPSHNLFS